MTERPPFSLFEAETMASQLYGITVVAHPLPGERDQNFLIKTKSGKQYVLKITNPAEETEILEMQNQAMAHVRRTWQTSAVSKTAEVLPCAEVLTAVSDKSIEFWAKNNTHYLIRLLTFLPGTLYTEVQPHSAHLQRDAGRFLGKLDQALASFYHPAAHRWLKWDLAQAGFINDYTQYISEDDGRRLVEHILNQFQTITLPRLLQQRHQIIHGDANDYNLLVHQHENKTDFSIIDFGDMVYTPLICELAIAAAYAILHQPDPILAAAQIIGGYHETYPLLAEEISLLPTLIAMRLCVSVTMSATNQIEAPDNEYLQISAQPAWETLYKLALVEPDFAERVFRQACLG